MHYGQAWRSTTSARRTWRSSTPRTRASTTAGRRSAAGPCRRRATERRQVDPGQPHPGPPRGRGRGRPWRHPRPRHLRGRVVRAAASSSSTPAAGSGRCAASTAGRGAGRDRGRARGRRDVRRGRHRRRHRRPTRPSSGCCAARGSPSCSPPTRSTTPRGEADAAALWTSASASRTRSPRFTAEAAATCSTPSSRRCRGRRASRRPLAGGPRRVALLGRPNVGKSSLLNRLAGAERVRRRRGRGHDPGPGRRADRARRQPWRFVDTAGIRRRVHQADGADYYASLRTQRRWRRPRSRSCCSTRGSR